MTTISEQIRQFLKTEQNHAELSRMAGLDKGCLSRFTNGQRGLILESIDRLASAMKLRLVRDGENSQGEHNNGEPL